MKIKINYNNDNYRDDIKLFVKIEKEQEILTETERMCSQDIGMEFGIKNVPC